jgi:hypothetical protein
MVLILALLAIWMYRRSGWEVLGRQFGFGSPTPGVFRPIEIGNSPVAPPAPSVEEIPTFPRDPRPAIPAEQQSEVLGFSTVMTESLNLREAPGYERRVIAVLPKYWQVAILRQLHVNPNGDRWIEVRAQTEAGSLKGWVMEQYLEPCNCLDP